MYLKFHLILRNPIKKTKNRLFRVIKDLIVAFLKVGCKEGKHYFSKSKELTNINLIKIAITQVFIAAVNKLDH